MKCKKCEHENDETSQFCNSCGAKLNKKEYNYILNFKEKINGFKEKIKGLDKKKKYIILASSVIIIIIIIGVIFFTNPILKFEMDIKGNNIGKATIIYNQNIKGNKNYEDKASTFLKDETSSIENKFRNEDIAYDKAKDKLDNIKDLDIVSLEINSSIKEIDTLNDSRVAFNKAQEYLKNEDYVNAIKQYSLVIKEDKNYDNAQKEIENNKDKYKDKVLEESEEYANNNEYDKAVSLLSETDTIIKNDNDIADKLSVYNKKLDDKKAQERKQKIDELKGKQEIEVISSSIVPDYFKINDEAEIIVKNNTNKVVKKYTVGILMYDSNGYPLKSGIIAGENELFQGKADSANIQPGQSSGENYVWNLYTNYGTINKIIACPMSVEYYDGSKWTNDYYQYWKEDYLGKQYK